MSMRVNLIPVSRQAARRRRALVRRWCAGTVGWAALLLLLVGAAHAAAQGARAGDATATQADLDLAWSEALATRSEVTRLQARLEQLRSEAHARSIVRDQPDWSILLALLAETRGEDVVLRGCDLAAVPRPAAPGRAASDDRVLRLELNGLGKSQGDVAAFVLRLESSGLFERVTMMDTRREPYLGQYVVAFRLECLLEESR